MTKYRYRGPITSLGRGATMLHPGESYSLDERDPRVARLVKRGLLVVEQPAPSLVEAASKKAKAPSVIGAVDSTPNKETVR